MARPPGSKNMIRFLDRKRIPTSRHTDVSYYPSSKNPLTVYQGQLSNARNFLLWLDKTQEALRSTISDLNVYLEANNVTSRRGPKGATSGKYKWYSQQLTLLESINGFESFVKQSLIVLTDLIAQFLKHTRFNGTVDVSRLIESSTPVSVGKLLWEDQLFHHPDSIDDATNKLIGAKLYTINRMTEENYPRGRALLCAFQIRHTLSHNCGYVTQSDMMKFRHIRFQVDQDQLIDPSKDQLGEAVLQFLEREAELFNAFLILETANSLNRILRSNGESIPWSKRRDFEILLGRSSNWDNLPWAQ